MVHEYSPIRSEVCLSQVTLQWETLPGMVMVPMTGITLTPSGMVMLLMPGKHNPVVRWEGHSGKVVQHSSMWLYMALGGFHLCPHILGCFATCGTITETPSRCSLLFDLKGWTHYLDIGSHQSVQVTSCQMEHSLFYSRKYSQVIALHGWALSPLPCYGERWSTNMLRSHALLGKAGYAMQLREQPRYHIEVPVGVPSVSTQCLGLLRVLEPSRSGTPLRVPPC